MSATSYRPSALDWRAKGLPWLDGTVEPADVAALGWNLFDGRFMLPTMVALESALAHDIELLAAYARARGVSYAPHGKTTMAPAIWQRQLDAGAWAITLATPWQARVAVQVGVSRIVIANEVVDDAGIDWLAATLEDPGPEVYCYVDSAVGVERLAKRLRGAPRRLPVLVEVGLAGTRAGQRTTEGALDVAGRVRAAAPLRLAGVSFFEGTVAGESREARVAAVRGLTDLAREVTIAIDPLVRGDGGSEVILSGGGSSYLDVVVDELTRPLSSALPVRVVVRAGATVTHDHGTYEAESPFGAGASPGSPRLRPALEVWCAILSVPEPGLAICGAGKRDLPYDGGLPQVLKVRGADGRIRPVAETAMRVTRLNDQHAYLAFHEAEAPAVGDLVGLGISHPCSAFDRWRWLPVVDDEYRVTNVYELFF